MKKHYVRMTVVICMLILFVFVMTGGFYTYIKATGILKIREDLNYFMDCFNNVAGDDSVEGTAEYLYFSSWNDMSRYRYEDVGFYSLARYSDGKTIEVSPYICVGKYRKDGSNIYVEDSRIIVLDEEIEDGFSPSSFGYGKDVAIDALCDDSFIFDGTITFKDSQTDEIRTYTIGDNDLVSGDNIISFDEWIGDGSDGTYAVYEYNGMSRNDMQAGLNEEARDTLNNYLNNTDGEAASFSSDLLTSYYIVHASSPADYDTGVDLYSIYFFHPIQTALHEHRQVYLIGGILLLLIEALTVFTMRRFYRDRAAYELKSRELTRSIAYDLRSPLEVTKSYVDNWEKIDGKDRAGYTEKLTHEVDIMTDTVNRLLKMSELGSEDIRINPEEVELYSLTMAVFKQLKPLISERGRELTVITDVKDGTYTVKADLEMMRLLIKNFLLNAIRFSDRKIMIKLFSDSRTITFAITNDGAMIGKRDLKKVWDVPVKTDDSEEAGSGMELAINKSILDLHKAKYGCTCDKSGTTFRFEMNKEKIS